MAERTSNITTAIFKMAERTFNIHFAYERALSKARRVTMAHISTVFYTKKGHHGTL
uniref:Uncharacterized protein n=1 Tax=Solanum tuberosum TaxID=4113 RepID=M1A8Q3_SOLTU